MLTRCPYGDCAEQWQQDEDVPGLRRSSNGFIKSTCPQCKRPATLRPLEIWQQMERKVTYLAGKNCLEGGPAQGAGLPMLSVVLDDIRSLHNVGSIFRSSDAFGFRQIHLCGITGTPDRHDVRKTSLTAEEYISWRYHINALDAINTLRASGTKIMSLERCQDSVDISKFTSEQLGPAPLCLVLGNEVSGVTEEVLAQSDFVCHIPMQGIKESLNVSVAFGVAAFCLSKVKSVGSYSAF